MKKLLIFLVLLFNSFFVNSQSVLLKHPLDSISRAKMEHDLCKPIDVSSTKFASNTNYWVLDSVLESRLGGSVIIPQVVQFKYDSLGNETETIEKRSQYPINWWKGEFFYNKMNRISKMIQYQGFDTITKTFTPYAKVLYSYTSDGRLINHKWCYWNVNQHKYMDVYGEFVYYYDAYKRLIKKVLSYNTNGTMKFYSKYLYSYDIYNNLSLDRSYEWKNGNWFMFQKKEKNYLGKDSLNWEIYLRFDENNGNVAVGSKTVYYRDANKNLIKYSIFNYQKATQNFDTVTYETTICDLKGNPSLTQWWSNNMVIRKQIYSYDNYNNVVSKSNYIVDTSSNNNNALILSSNFDYYLNYYIPSEKVILPKYFVWVGSSINTLEEKRSYLLDHYAFLQNIDFTTPNTIVDYAHYYYSQKTIVGIDTQQKTTEIRVFPNPLQNQFQIKGLVSGKEYRLLIYDIQGSERMNRIIHKGETVDAEKLNKGVYIYRLIDNRNVINGKIIVH